MSEVLVDKLFFFLFGCGHFRASTNSLYCTLGQDHLFYVLFLICFTTEKGRNFFCSNLYIL